MADEDAPSGDFKIERWGPQKLQKIWESIENGINERTPVAGMGIEIDISDKGSQISTSVAVDAARAENQGQGGGSVGTPVDLYGAYNGAPALFHLSQTSAPTPL